MVALLLKNLKYITPKKIPFFAGCREYAEYALWTAEVFPLLMAVDVECQAALA
jgi:hypothetical protein